MSHGRRSTVLLSIDRKKDERAHSALTWTHWMFLLFWLMKPIYTYPSGSMQYAGWAFIASFIMWLAENRWRLWFDAREKPFLAFFGCAVLINLIYYLMLKNSEFMQNSLFLLFNALVILEVRDLAANRKFLKYLLWASVFNLSLQMAVYLFGFGEYQIGNPRFMGTFNDPNQYAFSMFSGFLLIYLLYSALYPEARLSERLWMIYPFALSMYFTTLGNSAGMLLGNVCFLAAQLMIYLFTHKAKTARVLGYALLIAAFAMLLYFMEFGVSPKIFTAIFGKDSFFAVRLAEKFEQWRNNGFASILANRGLDKVLANPHFLLYGAGEGLYTRFYPSMMEVHSTLPGLWFCYGILPFTLLCVWIWKNLRGLTWVAVPAFIALLVESSTLAHHRQPAFWMLLVLGSLLAKQQEPVKYQIGLPQK